MPTNPPTIPSGHPPFTLKEINLPAKFDTRIIEMGRKSFLYLFSEESGGRLVNVDNIVSVVPNFKQGGSMIFLLNSDKAIAVDQPPEEIAECIEIKDNSNE